MSANPTPFRTVRWLLTGSLATVIGWAWYAKGIAPLRDGEQATRQRMAELSGQTESAGRVIEEMRAKEGQVADARAELDRWAQEYPAGSPMSWFPELVKSHFARFGVAVTIIRLNNTLAEPDLPGYDRVYWSMGLPIAEAKQADGTLLAAAELEQQHRFIRLLDFAIQPDPLDLSRRIAVVNMSALIKK